MQRLPITSKGFTTLTAELKRLKSVVRPKIVKAIEVARAHGDLSENAEYDAAKEAQALNEAKIGQLEDTLGRADIIDTSKLSGDKVVFGAIVTLFDLETEKELQYQIVGKKEADIKLNLISIESPIARALISKEQGDEVNVRTPGGERTFEIVDVNFE
jgi:transcription elongation factor GreA